MKRRDARGVSKKQNAFILHPLCRKRSPIIRLSSGLPGGASRFSRTDDGGVDWEIVVPPNTEAVVTLPVGTAADWQEGDHRLDIAEGVVVRWVFILRGVRMDVKKSVSINRIIFDPARCSLRLSRP